MTVLPPSPPPPALGGGLPLAPDGGEHRERANMGRTAGWLWAVAAPASFAATFLPGARHAGMGWVVALSVFAFAYGVFSITGTIPWRRASINALAIGMVLTVPVLGLAVFLSGGAISYVQPFTLCALLYAAFFFPARWAWPLAIELIAVIGAPLLYDGRAIELAYLPRYFTTCAAFLVATSVLVGLKRRLVEAEAYQREIANRDPLTGAGNRRAFEAVLYGELQRRSRPRGGRRQGDASPLGLLILDLDDFKGVNDRHGHPVGDAVLREAAVRASSILRSTDSLARIGGDEFAVIAPGADRDGVERLAESICTAVSLPEPGSSTPTPSASVGWAVFPEDGEDFESLLRAADERMLRRKRHNNLELLRLAGQSS